VMTVPRGLLKVMRVKTCYFTTTYNVSLNLQNDEGNIEVSGTDEATAEFETILQKFTQKTLEGILIESNDRIDIRQLEERHAVILRPFPRDKCGISKITIYGVPERIMIVEKDIRKVLAPASDETKDKVWIEVSSAKWGTLKKYEIGHF
ncbi:hypothetical protein SK128_019969, partial [Halocaridina rubra]